jgi:hypothetical protein
MEPFRSPTCSAAKLFFFASYALAGLTLPTSSFFVTLLENYGL